MDTQRLTFDLLPDGVIVVDAQGRIGYANPAALALFGYCAAELLGMAVEQLVPPDQARRHAAMRQGFVRLGQPLPMGRVSKVYGQCRDGSTRLVDVTLSRIAGTGEVVVHLRDLSRSVDHAQRQSERLRLDAMTGIPNRRALRDDLATRLAAAAQGQAEHHACLVVLDIDQFKVYNETLGHSAGDRLLEMLAERLQGVQGEDAVLYRISGDEFAFLAQRPAATYLPERLIERIAAAMQVPFQFSGHTLHLQASVGYACSPEHGESVDTLMANADLALQASKRALGRPQGYEHHYRQRTEHRHTLLGHLRRALQEQQFELHYQPQADLKTGQIIGLEALLRWNHPEWGMLLPHDFMDVLADSPLSVTVGAWVLEQACRQVADWNATRPRPLRVAVNVFPRQFDRDILPGAVAHALQVSGLPPELLEIEITENIALTPGLVTTGIFEALLAQGVALVMDDFGTGFASLTCLAHHPVRKLKIDKSFVDGLGTGRGYQAILCAIRTLAGAMGLETVVEGVETEATAQMMREFGFDLGQGFLWSRPLAPEACAALLAQEGGAADKP